MKNRLIILTFILIGLSPNIYGQSFADFKSLVENCEMNFAKPLELMESQVIDNDDMGYEFALKYANKDFEVRYSIRPITYLHYTNDTIKNQMESQRPFRNAQYEIIFKTVMLNLTGGVEYNYTIFDTSSVKNEFNADWGATTFLDLASNGEFGKGYKYCMIVAIHKKDIADAYYFYLSNTKEGFMDNVDPLFHSLRFN